jgi:hypothetical protein
MSPRHSHRADGFSLIEVMVAVFILAVALVGLTRGITTALGSSKDAEVFSQAVSLAVSRIEFLRADGTFRDGETEGTAGAYTWRQTISGTPTAGLHEVVVAVDRSSGKDPMYSLRTFLYQAPVDTATERTPKGPDAGKNKRKTGRKP